MVAVAVVKGGTFGPVLAHVLETQAAPSENPPQLLLLMRVRRRSFVLVVVAAAAAAAVVVVANWDRHHPVA